MPYSYDLWLVVLSFLIAVLAAYVALSLAARLPHVEERQVWRWLVGGSIGMGIGIWAMHFIGMLAFHLPIPLGYDMPITIASLLLAVISSGFALYFIRQGIKNLITLLISAALMGSGIAAMHYTGMEALRMSPAIEYNTTTVVLSLIIAYLASYQALKLAFHNEMRSPLLFSSKQLLSALVMGSAIAGMHYVGMQAAYFSPGSVCLAAPSGISSGVMATIIASVTLLLLFGMMLLLSYDSQRAKQNAILVGELRQLNHQLRTQAEELALSMTENLREGHQRERLLVTIVEQSSEAIITVDMSRRIQSWNHAAEKMFGYRNNEVIGQSLQFISLSEEEYARLGKLGDYQCYRDRSGTLIYVRANSAPMFDENGIQTGEIIIMHDATQERSQQEQMQLWGLVFKNSGEAIVITDAENRILSVNHAFSRITGYSTDEVIGQNPRMLASGRHDHRFYEKMWHSLHQTGYWKGEVWNKRKDGTVYPEWLTLTSLVDNEGKPSNYIAIFSDVSSYKEKEARIEFLAQHDTLTGLPNRNLLNDRLEQSIYKAQRDGEKVAVLFIDLDRFKNINDTLGHHIGDQLLKEVALRLRKSVRNSDTVCRQGGDEFIIILPEISRIDNVAHIAQSVLATISEDYTIDDERLHITPSIGISLYPEDGTQIPELVKHADAAMYHAKDSGRANFQFFTEELNTQLTERLALEQALSTAVQNNELELHFQPKVNIAGETIKITGAEALLRWQHPTRGMVPPDLFIPIAEDTGSIKSIGHWVLEQLLKKVSAWKSDPALNGLVFSANVSPRQLSPLFERQLQELFNRYSCPPECIELEITETAVMEDIQNSITYMDGLKRMGLNLAIDDFGTGYSSLSYLKRLPLDRLKIDRSFISDIPQDQNDETITLAIINLARTLKLEVIAEGVETEEQAAFLRQAACFEAQGYLYSRPLNEADFIDFVHRHVG